MQPIIEAFATENNTRRIEKVGGEGKFSLPKKKQKAAKENDDSYVTTDTNLDLPNVGTSAAIAAGVHTTSPMSVSSSIMEKAKMRKRTRRKDWVNKKHLKEQQKDQE